MGPVLQEVEAGQCPKWKDIAIRSSVYNSYWVQWESLAAGDGMLECHWGGNQWRDPEDSGSPSTEPSEGGTGQVPWKITGRASGC
jgi:hypothetical protein